MTSAYSHYEILDIPQSASDAEIKRAYYLMAKRYHPDLHPHNRILAERRLQLINEAYENLKTREARARYNQSLRLKAENDNKGANSNEKSIFSHIAEIFWPANKSQKN